MLIIGLTNSQIGTITANATIADGMATTPHSSGSISYSILGINSSYTTGRYYVTDETGASVPMYCIEPNKSGFSGTQATGNGTVYSSMPNMSKVLFFGYGGPEQSILRTELANYNPNITITDDALYCITHILVSIAWCEAGNASINTCFTGTGITYADIEAGQTGPYSWIGNLYRNIVSRSLPTDASMSKYSLQAGTPNSDPNSPYYSGYGNYYIANLGTTIGWGNIVYISEKFTGTGTLKLPTGSGLGVIDWTECSSRGSLYFACNVDWSLVSGHQYSIVCSQTYYNNHQNGATESLLGGTYNTVIKDLGGSYQKYAYSTFGTGGGRNYTISFAPATPTEQEWKLVVNKKADTLSGVSGTAGNYTFNYATTNCEGTVFVVTAKENFTSLDGVAYVAGQELGRGTSDSNGNVTITGIPLANNSVYSDYSTYVYVEEISTNPNLVLNTTKYEVVTKYENGNITTSGNIISSGVASFVNDRKKASVSATKVDANNNTILLAGAEFGLYNSEAITLSDGTVILAADTLIKTATTGADGTATFNVDIPINYHYYVKETKAPTGYVLDDVTKKELYFNSTTDTATTSFNFNGSNAFADNQQKTGITIYKNGEILSGVTPANDGGVVFNYTNANLNDFSFNIFADGDITDTAGNIIYSANTKIATAVTGSATGTSLVDGITPLTFTTNGNGDVTVSGLPIGKYVIREVNGPAQWFVDASIANNIVTVGDTTGNTVAAATDITITNDRKKATVSATKVDANDNTVLLQGAVFGLYNSDAITLSDGTVILAADSLIETATTGADGTASFSADLPINFHYYVKEIQNPEGYVLDDVTKKELNFTDTTTVATTNFNFNGNNAFTNNEQTGTLTISKHGDVLTGVSVQGEDITFEYTDAEIGGFTFDIFAKADITNKAGQVIYTAGTKVATIITGSAAGTSYVDDKTPLVFSASTNGSTTVKGLLEGTYTVKEVSAAAGYVADTTVENDVTTVIDATGNLYGPEVSTQFTNARQRAQVSAFKKDSNNLGMLTEDMYLQGCEFTLYAGEDIISVSGQTLVTKDTKITTAVTDANGEAVFQVDLPYGFDFYVKETKAPEGFLLDDTSYNFEFIFSTNGNDSVIKFGSKTTSSAINTPVVGEIEVLKQSAETGLDIPQAGATFVGAVYEVFAAEDIKYPGSSTIKWTTGTKIAEIVIGDAQSCASCVDENGYVLSFSTYAENQISVKGLLLGKYTVKEAIAPDGYLLDDTEYAVTLAYADQYTAVITESITSVEQVEKAPFNIKKVGNKTSAPTRYNLEGAEFKIYLDSELTGNSYDTAYSVKKLTNPNTNEVLYSTTQTEEDALVLLGFTDIEEVVLVTDKDGYAESGLLPYGTYKLHETKAPSGYKLNTTDTEIVIDANVTDGSFITAEPFNIMNWLIIVVTEKPVKITKYAATGGKELPGATLELYNWQGVLIDTWVSTDTAHEVYNLHVGETYTLKETIAPTGYALAEDVKFTVSGDWTVSQQVKMYDKFKWQAKMGEDHGVGFYITLFAICAVIVGGTTFVIIRKRKKNEVK